MHTLHTRAATIFSSWAEEERHRLAEPREPYLEGLPGIDAGTSTLWTKCWCPLLQGMKFPDTRYSLNFEQRIVLSWFIQTELMWERDRVQNGSLYFMSNLHTVTYVGT